MNGDLAYDGASLGLLDDATFESAWECLGRLKAQFRDRLQFTLGDHELGKLSLLGERGGLRLESWRRAVELLGLKPGWRMELGNRVLLGVASTRLRGSGVIVPYWFAMLLTLPLPLFIVTRRMRRSCAILSGRCAKCGYDLRASPERCPECGTIVELAVRA